MAKPFAILSHCQKNGYDIYNCLKKTAATLPEGPVDERKVLSVINIYLHTSCSYLRGLRQATFYQMSIIMATCHSRCH